MGRAPLSREEFIAAALALVDERGFAALTIRSLGEAVGASHTAIYRHFPDVSALLTAVSDTLIAGSMADPPPDDASPRDRLVHRFRRIRAAFAAHPNIVIPTASTGGPRPVQLVWTRLVIGDLEAMGLTGERLVLAFRLLESFGTGTTMFDLGGAPDHLELRRLRMRSLDHADFDAANRTAADVAATNEAAFELGLRVLLDACEALVADADGARD